MLLKYCILIYLKFMICGSYIRQVGPPWHIRTPSPVWSSSGHSERESPKWEIKCREGKEMWFMIRRLEVWQNDYVQIFSPWGRQYFQLFYFTPITVALCWHLNKKILLLLWTQAGDNDTIEYKRKKMWLFLFKCYIAMIYSSKKYFI